MCYKDISAQITISMCFTCFVALYSSVKLYNRLLILYSPFPSVQIAEEMRLDERIVCMSLLSAEKVIALVYTRYFANCHSFMYINKLFIHTAVNLKKFLILV